MPEPVPADFSSFLDALRVVVGAPYVLNDAQDVAPFFHEYSGRYHGKGLAVVLPASTDEVSRVMALCHQHNVVVVPQGGNTGLVGGSVPYRQDAIVLSLKRMNTIRSVDVDNFTMTVDAGVVLETIQQSAQEQNRFFPLALGAQGSCCIGGNIATNAGGILTLRYGNTRDLVLGLEVVLPDGRIWDGLRSLRKDNSGYNLKQLFIGSEGTLGVITGAVLRLFPDPGQRVTSFVAAKTLDDVVALLGLMRRHFGEQILAFELISRRGMECVMQYLPQAEEPMQSRAPCNVLLEVTAHHKEKDFAQRVENVLAEAFEARLVHDAVVAQNEEQRRRFWRIRECVSDAAQAHKGGSIKHDIAVSIADIPAFVRDADPVVAACCDGAEAVVFGHIGDGNLHYDVITNNEADAAGFMQQWEAMNNAVYDVVARYNGSFAAEHGVGAFKVHDMHDRKPHLDVAMMKKIKQAIDPKGIMNPNVIWTADHE